MHENPIDSGVKFILKNSKKLSAYSIFLFQHIVIIKEMRRVIVVSQNFSEKENKSKKEQFQEKIDHLRRQDPTKILQSVDEFFKQSFAALDMPVDILDTEDEWLVKAYLPGIEKKQINLEVLDEEINIVVLHKEETNQYDETYHYHKRERKMEEATRKIRLPFTANTETVHANYENGVLYIKGEKSEKNTKRIEID
ncbi:heat shock protein Hsp20 [Saliterribacillus persicus]|uniref:Heat shock protein Hsp20 n=1 Tax=Saliterribacillus persicus TaxID=930114 RepID=A0A368YB82_9BACI|nr:heat shock protein Hsp20 [Saliterribacillus persicus]